MVRATGGLVDTVTDTTPETLSQGKATGFSFEALNASVLDSALRRAVDTSWQNEGTGRQLVSTGMQQDWSWKASAARYVEAYARASARRQEERQRLMHR